MLDRSDDNSSSAQTASPKTDLEQRAKIFAALSDPTRLRIVEMLAEQGEMSGSEIAHQSNISLALFCHHSKILAEADLIHTRKEGQTKYHALHRSLLVNCLTSFSGLCNGRSAAESQ